MVTVSRRRGKEGEKSTVYSIIAERRTGKLYYYNVVEEPLPGGVHRCLEKSIPREAGGEPIGFAPSYRKNEERDCKGLLLLLKRSLSWKEREKRKAMGKGSHTYQYA